MAGMAGSRGFCTLAAAEGGGYGIGFPIRTPARPAQGRRISWVRRGFILGFLPGQRDRGVRRA